MLAKRIFTYWLAGFLTQAFSLAQATVAESANNTTPNTIEEVLVYGKRQQATVSDTSLSITAFSEQFLRDTGIVGPDELVNFIPATTRTDWDLKIRGVGTNFRGVGGDPGVGTYYNGVYSPDFAIAATESGLFDLKRIEVLRGPQGTLYGRNSIGGVVNYVTNQPNHDALEAKFRTILGEYGTEEFYGVVSGPISNAVAYRLTGVRRIRDGWIEGQGASDDLEGYHDQNFTLTLDWQYSENLSANLRINDRRALTNANFGIGANLIVSEGPCVGAHPITSVDDCDQTYRVNRETQHYTNGLRAVAADYPGAIPYTHPVTGVRFYGAHNRPGVDPDSYPYSPSPNYHNADVAGYDAGSATSPKAITLNNNRNREEFDHQAATLTLDLAINEQLSLQYLGNYQAYDYYYNTDEDHSPSLLSSRGDTALVETWSWSHELRLFWEIGERWSATSGLYAFHEDRKQLFAERNRFGKGYATNPAIYGPEGNEDWARIAFPWLPDCFDWRTSEIGGPGGFGAFCGDEGRPYSQKNDVGAIYEHENEAVSDTLAIYTQGDFKLSESLTLTFGVRYAEDERQVLEARGGYSEFEFTSPDFDWVPLVLAGTAPLGFDSDRFFDAGVTPLAALNVALGAASFTGNSENPIVPTCSLEAINCERPLRLGGLPISWGSRAEGDFDSSSFTFRANLNWTPTDNSLLYLGATSGYRAGGFNLGGTDNRTTIDTDGDGFDDTTVLGFYDDEELVSYELGYKGLHFGGQLQLNAAIFYYVYDNYQDSIDRWEATSGDFVLPSSVAAPAGRGPVNVTTNIPEATTRGFEMEFTWLLNEHFRLGGNYSYTKSEFGSDFTFFSFDDPRFPRAVFGGDISADPCTLEAELRALYCVEASGLSLTGVPENKAVLWASYAWRSSAGVLTLFSSTSYTGDYRTGPLDRPWDEVPERYRTDMRVSFESAKENWLAAFYVDNVFDDDSIRWSTLSAEPLSAHRVTRLTPRMFGFEFEYRFGSS